jgi:hypothetical protein
MWVKVRNARILFFQKNWEWTIRKMKRGEITLAAITRPG